MSKASKRKQRIDQTDDSKAMIRPKGQAITPAETTPHWSDKIFFNSWRPYAWIVFIISLVYFRALGHQFVYFDDNVLILDNFWLISKLSNIGEAFRREVFLSLHSSASYYRPFLTISFMIDAAIGGIKPFIYYFSNILYHALACSLLFIFLLKLNYSRRLSFFGTLFFAVSPILTQAVAWIPGRNDSLLAIFALASAIHFISYIKTRSWWSFGWHILLFTGAVFTKESALALPFLLLLYVWLIAKKKIISLPTLYLVIGWVIPVVIWFLLRQEALAVNQNPLELKEALSSIFFSLPALVVYFGKIFLPADLSVLPILEDSTPVYGVISLLGILVILWFSKARRSNYLLFSTIWFLAILIPSFVKPHLEVGADFIEHRTYLPLAGFIPLILEFGFVQEAFALNKKELLNKIYLALLIAVLLIFSVLTFLHTSDYRDRLSFWHNAATTSPHSPLAHRNLGAMYYLNGDLDKAEAEYKSALALNPTEQMAHNNLGLIYANKKMYREAEAEYLKELEINPRYDNAHYNLGLLYYALGRVNEAANLWLKTLELNPDYIDAYHNIAILYLLNGNLDKAREYAQEVVKRGGKLHPELAAKLNMQ
ncbi:MAG: tetratricopeptide repeat protein [Candidatus Margulisiibacteriota bacterium]|jgi:Flp pilus assembly protein TadD